jgi:hypothetical protein
MRPLACSIRSRMAATEEPMATVSAESGAVFLVFWIFLVPH